MASNLRVDQILPTTGTNIGIGTAGGNIIVGGATTEVVVNGGLHVTGNVQGGTASFLNISAGFFNGFHVDGGAPASSLTVDNLGNTVVGSGHSLYINNGNLVFSTAGTGIDFSATADGGTSTPSEILDDYEEGSWNPQINGWNGSYSIQEGRYIKIGRMVHLIGEVKTDANVGNSFTYAWPGLSNLPFANTTSFQGVSGSQRHMGTATMLGDVSPSGTNGIAFVTFDRTTGTAFFPNHISSAGAQNFQNTMINNPTTVDFGYRFNCTYYTD